MGVGRVIVEEGGVCLVWWVWVLVSVVVLLGGSGGVMGLEDVFDVWWVIGFFCGAVGLVVPELLELFGGSWWVWCLVVEVFCPGGGVVVGDATGVQSYIIGPWRGSLIWGFGDRGIPVLEEAVGMGVEVILGNGVVLG